jgi:predicted AAA+ superfamily ATPase
MIQRDVRDIAEIEGRAEIPRLLELLATQAMSLVNASEISRIAGIPHTTLKRYIVLLEATFLVQMLRPWSASARKRLVRTPKVMLNDSGLLAHLLALDKRRLAAGSASLGPLLENFVAQELCKQITWSREQPRVYFYRTSSGHEVDFVLERRDGRIVGIEVKASATLGRNDLRGLDDLANVAGKRFHRGVILYTGREVVPFARHLHAVPITALTAV